MTFNLDAWAALDGFIVPEEGLLIYEEALKLPCGSRIVEIGCYHGKSTVALLQGCKDSECYGENKKTVLSVDKFDGQGMTQGDATTESQRLGLEVTLGTISYFGLATWFEGAFAMSSEEWFAAHTSLHGQVDMFFIDGFHSIVHEDMRSALLYLKPGGIMLCHDYWPYGHYLDWITKLIDSVELNGTRLGNTTLYRAVV